MKSKIEGRNYVVLYDDDRFPVKINKKRLDSSLINLNISLKKIQLLMKELYQTDYDAYAFIRNNVFDYQHFDFDEGSSFLLDNAIDTISSLHEWLLTNHDEILPREEVETLEDLGYQWFGGGFAHIMYEKILEDTDEKEVVEEIQEVDGKMLRRIRTTLWEKTHYGKSSLSINYKKIGNTKRLVKAFLNSMAKHKKKSSC